MGLSYRFPAGAIGLIAAGVLGAAPLRAQTDTAVVSLVAAENDFARLAGESGTRTAFLTWLADSAVVFRPGPVPARQWFAARPASPARLSWYPVRAEVSAAGDLGYTTGPYVYRAPQRQGRSSPTAASDADTVVRYGDYFTVWGRRPGKPWRVLLDHGVGHPPADSEPPWPARGLAESGVAGGPDAGPLMADRRFAAEAITAPSSPLYSRWLAVGAELLRDGLMPALGDSALEATIATQGVIRRWLPLGGASSSSGDLGYTYGSAGLEAGGKLRPAHYVRLWRRAADGRWRVAVEVLTYDD